MRVRSLDVNGDWNFGKGRNDYLVDEQALMQLISTRLQSFLGDCFFAIDEGIDWFNLLGGKNRIQIELDVRAVIMNTTGVTGLVSMEMNFDGATRILTMTYKVLTIYSQQYSTTPVVASSSFLLTESGDILVTESGDPISAG